MDWTKQADAMIKTWTGTQQKMWSSWMETMQNMSSPTSPGAWEKTVESWRGTITSALEAQVELTRLWTESLQAGMSSGNMPAGMADWTKQMLDVTKSFTETQTRLSETWFDMIKRADPSTMAQMWDPTKAQDIMQNWQDASKKAMEAQSEWARMMMGNAAPDKGDQK